MQQNPLKSVRIHQGNDGLRPAIWWSVSSAAAWRSRGSRPTPQMFFWMRKMMINHENTMRIPSLFDRF